MEITITGTKVLITGDRIIGFALNNLVNRFEASTDLSNDWSYQLYVYMVEKDLYNVINLDWLPDTQSIYVDLTADMLPFSGRYIMQFAANKGSLSSRTEKFEVWVKNSIDPCQEYSPVPSEFYQIQEDIRQMYEDVKDMYDKIEDGSVLDIDAIHGGDAFGDDEESVVESISGGSALI